MAVGEIKQDLEASHARFQQDVAPVSAIGSPKAA
jgi:hypothetical protein